jgi:uncharacterized delta-60 repeat protein
LAVALAGDGSILVGGVVGNGSGNTGFVLAKYSRDGALDTAFGVGGTAKTSFGRVGLYPVHILVQPDGKILYGAETRSAGDAALEYDIALARYTSAGALDPTFGTGGTQTTSLDQGYPVLSGMVLQSTGAIVVSANTYFASGRFVLLRYTPAGALDTTFGSGGVTSTDFFGRFQYATGLSLLPGDTLIAAGTVIEPTDAGPVHDFGFALYDADGHLESSHAPGGKLVTLVRDQINPMLFAQALQSDGKLVVAGYGRRTTDAGSVNVLDILRYGCP